MTAEKEENLYRLFSFHFKSFWREIDTFNTAFDLIQVDTAKKTAIISVNKTSEQFFYFHKKLKEC